MLYFVLVQATFDCLLKTYGFLTPDFWSNTLFTKSPFQQYTDLLSKPTSKVLITEVQEGWVFRCLEIARNVLFWYRLRCYLPCKDSYVGCFWVFDFLPSFDLDYNMFYFWMDDTVSVMLLFNLPCWVIRFLLKCYANHGVKWSVDVF